jgi:hypothetical protein
MKLSIVPVIRENSLMSIQNSLITSNPLRDAAVMRFIEFPQRPLKVFKALIEDEQPHVALEGCLTL